MKVRTGWLCVVAMLLVIAWRSPASALTVEREPIQEPKAEAMVWSVGQIEGGDIRTLAIQPTDPDHLLAGTASGQVFRSLDGGDSWQTAGDAVPFPGWVVSDLLFDHQDPGRVWAALRGVRSESGFVALSEDGGETWESRSGGLPGRQVYALARAPEQLYAATRFGVWGSRDGGESWAHLTGAHAEIQKVTSLLVDPLDPLRVFAGTWRRAYRSDDGGASWRGVFDGMVLDSEVFSLHAVPGSGGELWASTCGWVYRSRGLGEAWQRFANGLPERRTPSFQALADGGRLAGTVAGVYRSEDDGLSWQRVTPADLVALAIEHHPQRPEQVFIGSEGAGVWRSIDGGRTFQPANRGLNAVRVASLTALDGEILAAVRHSGPASGVYSSFDGGATFPLGPVELPTVIELANDGENVFAATDEGLWERTEDTWGRIEGINSQPVRQVASTGDRVVARTDDGLWLRPLRGAAFERLRFDRGRIASIALEAEMLWISTASGGLFRLVGNEAVAVATPVGRGRIESVEGRLLISGLGELWERRGMDAAWSELGRELDFHPTGSADFPLVLIGADGEVRLGGDGRFADRTLGLEVPARDLSAALVKGERLLLGTSGYGVLVGELQGAEELDAGSALESAR